LDCSPDLSDGDVFSDCRRAADDGLFGRPAGLPRATATNLCGRRRSRGRRVAITPTMTVCSGRDACGHGGFDETSTPHRRRTRCRGKGVINYWPRVQDGPVVVSGGRSSCTCWAVVRSRPVRCYPCCNTSQVLIASSAADHCSLVLDQSAALREDTVLALQQAIRAAAQFAQSSEAPDRSGAGRAVVDSEPISSGPSVALRVPAPVAIAEDVRIGSATSPGVTHRCATALTATPACRSE
jgi:hypothetical protein